MCDPKCYGSTVVILFGGKKKDSGELKDDPSIDFLWENMIHPGNLAFLTFSALDTTPDSSPEDGKV